jgi:TolB-like protein
MGADYFTVKLPPNTKIAFVAMRSPTENLSNYVIDTTIMHLVNTDKFAVIERSELPALQREQLYQVSGEVSDETAVLIGNQLGVQVIITGTVMETGNNYSLRLKAINVETAQIIGTRIFSVAQDQTLAALLKSPAPVPGNNPSQTETPQKPPQTVINGDINITNNNTTTINGDVYVNKPNWINFE